MTETVKAFQKHGFGLTKASTNFFSVTPLSASLASLHVILILFPGFPLLGLTHPQGLGPNFTSEKPVLMMQPHVSHLSGAPLGFIDHN